MRPASLAPGNTVAARASEPAAAYAMHHTDTATPSLSEALRGVMRNLFHHDTSFTS